MALVDLLVGEATCMDVRSGNTTACSSAQRPGIDSKGFPLLHRQDPVQKLDKLQ
jgi:hypothetical protein